jgi:calcineurin-like phosphoesterase family protein
MKYFSSDWHLFHRNVIKFSDRPFKTLDEMNQEIIRRAFSKLKAGDSLYLLGDISWNEEGWKLIQSLAPKNVEIHLILGNHEVITGTAKQVCRSITPFKEVKIQGNLVTLCHYPMVTWNRSHYNAWLLFGHHHAKSHGMETIEKYGKNGKVLNVNVEFHNYYPWSEG